MREKFKGFQPMSDFAGSRSDAGFREAELIEAADSNGLKP